MKKDIIEDVLEKQTLEERYKIVSAGYLHTIDSFCCLISDKIPQNPVILRHDGGLYERKVLQSIIDDKGGYFLSPKTGNMITIENRDLEPTTESIFFEKLLSNHFQLMWMFKDLCHTNDQDKLLDLLCTKGSIEEDELDMRARQIKKIITDNPSVVQFKLGIYYGIRCNNLLELMCKFPLVQNSNYDNRCITSTLFYRTIETLNSIEVTSGNHGTLFSQLRHQLLRQSDRDHLAQSLRDRISDLLSHPNQVDMDKITLLRSCGASLMINSSGGFSLLHKALKNDLNDVVKIFLNSEKLPIQNLQETFQLAVDKIHLTTSTPLIQVLYEVSQRYKDQVQLDMHKIIERTVKKYIENEQGQDEDKWRERLDLVLYLLTENERVDILNSTLTIGKHESMPYAWHAVNTKTFWLLDCLLSNGANFLVDGDLKNSAIYHAIEQGDNLKLQLMFNLINDRGMHNLCSDDLYDKLTENGLLRLAYGIKDPGMRETVYRTLFTAGIEYYNDTFPYSLYGTKTLSIRNTVKGYYDSVKRECSAGNERPNSRLKKNRYEPSTFFFPDTEIDISTINDDSDSEDKEYAEHQDMQSSLDPVTMHSDSDYSNSIVSPTAWVKVNNSPENDGSRKSRLSKNTTTKNMVNQFQKRQSYRYSSDQGNSLHNVPANFEEPPNKALPSTPVLKPKQPAHSNQKTPPKQTNRPPNKALPLSPTDLKDRQADSDTETSSRIFSRKH